MSDQPDDRWTPPCGVALFLAGLLLAAVFITGWIYFLGITTFGGV